MLSHLMNKDLMASFIKEHMPKFTQEEKLDIANLVLQEALADKRYIFIPYKDSSRFVNMDTVLYYFQPNKALKSEMHLITGEIVNCSVSDDIWAQIENLEDDEDNFRKFYNLDNGLLVNRKMIRYYHSYMRRVYFSDEHSIPVSPAATKHILPKILGKEKDIYLQKDKSKMFEYSPLTSR